MIPDFDEHGLLPPGLHRCTWPEMTARFGFNAWRQRRISGLRAFLDVELPALCGDTPHERYIDGSFVRSKAEPDDIDIILDASKLDAESAIALACFCYLRRTMWEARYKVEVMVYHPALPDDIKTFFTYIGRKAAAELNLPPKHQKGYLWLTS